jgi:transposase-like protein
LEWQKKDIDSILDEAVKKHTSFKSASEFTEFKTSVDNSEQIKELEEEMKTIPNSDSGLGKKRILFLRNKISELKKQLL